MGVDICFGLRRGDQFYRLVQDIFHGKKMTLPDWLFDEPERQPSCGGRGYDFHKLGEHCRKHDLPYIHMPKISCSHYQLIVPIDFQQPINEFRGKSPEDYEADFFFVFNPERMTEKEYREVWRKHRYPYYAHTYPEDIYMLSSQRLLAEVEDLKEPYLNQLKEWGFDHFDPDDDHFDYEEYQYIMSDEDFKMLCAADHIQKVCQYSVEERQPIYFCG